jgi:hypothetical protein
MTRAKAIGTKARRALFRKTDVAVVNEGRRPGKVNPRRHCVADIAVSLIRSAIVRLAASNIAYTRRVDFTIVMTEQTRSSWLRRERRDPPRGAQTEGVGVEGGHHRRLAAIPGPLQCLLEDDDRMLVDALWR